MHLSVPTIIGAASVVQAFPHFAYPNTRFALPPSKGLKGLKTGNESWGTLKPNHFIWSPPGPNDQRAPCPVMNTLSNHGFVPHDGRNITKDILIKALNDALNVPEAPALNIFNNALVVNPVPNATFFDLQMLHAHNVIEHDGSLSRKDAIFDPTNAFDVGTFDNFVSYFGDEEAINITMIANARARHAFDMSLINPTFSITDAQIPVIVGENAFLLAIFGDPDVAVANRTFLEYFFRNERFPVELGWSPNETPIDAQLGPIVQDIIAQSPADVPLTFTPQNASLEKAK